MTENSTKENRKQLQWPAYQHKDCDTEVIAFKNYVWENVHENISGKKTELYI